MHISTSPIFFYWLETTKNTTISIFNTKKIRNLQFPLIITDFNFRLSSGNNNIILWAFCIPFTRDTPIPEQQLQHRVTHNDAKPKELQRLTVSTYHHIHPT